MQPLKQSTLDDLLRKCPAVKEMEKKAQIELATLIQNFPQARKITIYPGGGVSYYNNTGCCEIEKGVSGLQTRYTWVRSQPLEIGQATGIVDDPMITVAWLMFLNSLPQNTGSASSKKIDEARVDVDLKEIAEKFANIRQRFFSAAKGMDLSYQPDSCLKVEALSVVRKIEALARCYVGKEEFDKALGALKIIKDAKASDALQKEIAEKLFKKGAHEKIKEMIAGSDSSMKSDLSELVIDRCLRDGNLREAVEYISLINDSSIRNVLYGDAAKQFAIKGEFEKAKITSGSINCRSLREFVLRSIRRLQDERR